MKSLLFFVLSFLPNVLLAFTSVGHATIDANLSFLKEGDTVKFNVYKFGNFANCQLTRTTINTVVKGRHLEIEIRLTDHPQYIDMIFPVGVQNNDLCYYLISSGDHIYVRNIGDRMSFSGVGSMSWTVQSNIHEIGRRYQARYLDRFFGTAEDFTRADSVAKTEFKYLYTEKSRLPYAKFYLICADIVGDDQSAKYYRLASYRSFKDSLSDIKRSLSAYKDPQYKGFDNNVKDLVQYSNSYCDGLIAKYKKDSCILVSRLFNLNDGYHYFKKRYSGILRQRLVTLLLYSNLRFPGDDLENDVHDALTFVNNKNYKPVLEWLRSNRTKGAKAYDFSLADTNGKIYHLSDFKNKVVLLDFWFTGCGACRALYPKLREVEEKFKDMPVEFISVSADVNRDLWIRSIHEGRYTSADILNLYTEGEGDHHPINHYYNVEGYPTLILIDKTGHVCSNPVSPLADNGKGLTAEINQLLK